MSEPEFRLRPDPIIPPVITFEDGYVTDPFARVGYVRSLQEENADLHARVIEMAAQIDALEYRLSVALAAGSRLRRRMLMVAAALLVIVVAATITLGGGLAL